MLFFGLPVRIYTPLYLSRHRGILSLATLNIFLKWSLAEDITLFAPSLSLLLPPFCEE